VIAIIAILAGLLLPALARAREESRRKSCDSNLSQIVKAATTYQEPNGDFFPAFMQQVALGAATNPYVPVVSSSSAQVNQGCDGSFQPMPSLAVLYPAYVDNVRVFGCPSTSDKPLIAYLYFNGARHTAFGYKVDPLETGPSGPTGAATITSVPTTTGYNNSDPAYFSGAEVSGTNKCSYLYDELTNFRDIGPGQAICGDADGFIWLTATGQPPSYTTANFGVSATGTQGSSLWGRMPKKPNHGNGQNVMYFDGHVKWIDNVYASRDPNDNIYSPNAGWGVDTDAYLWDGGAAEFCIAH